MERFEFNHLKHPVLVDFLLDLASHETILEELKGIKGEAELSR